MSDKKNKIRKYQEAEQIGKEQQVAQESKVHTEKADAKQETKDEAVETSKDLEERLRAAEAKAEECHNKYLRLYAEFENYKKRSAREMQDIKKYANEELLKAMLSVVDNLELAIRASNEHTKDQNGIVEGIDMTLKHILSILEKYHVKPIDSVGKPFDPRYHEALLQEESDEHPENTVINELQKGYMLYDRLLRPAVVAVSKAKEEPGTEDKENQNNN
ncbi:MAG: nucleotide exchange factor GrpE [Deltaproteobacteria bacterium]|nr:nucleotide exchange factor GrpE [Deltaproteobacteria bacterium]MBW2152109.1 nucleotide exchange factor GrpE [Deltaproteobacteria bacterium]